MADNYLEKKMEEYRSGVPRPARKLTPSGHKPGYAILPYKIKTAFIKADKTGIILDTIARSIRDTGCRVAVSCPDGNALAQKLSCAYVPVGEKSLETICSKWGEVELLIEVAGTTVSLSLGRGNSTIYKSENIDVETYAKRAAELCIYLSLPDSASRVYGEFYI